MLTRRLFVLASAFALLHVAPARGAAGAPPDTCKLTLLHTNDTHGHLMPFSYPDTFDPGSILARLTARRNIGGIARRATLASIIRREPGAHVLLLDAGDICDGTPFSTEFRGEADVEAMNAAGYDAACPGNHEMNNTLAQVRKLRDMAKYPIVCANAIETASGKPIFRPYVIRRVGSLRIALLGLLTPEAASYPAAVEGLKIQPPIECARDLVPQLRRQADLVIALTHIGADQDRLLSATVAGIDVIVGGHSHTYLRSPVFIGDVPGPEPESVNGTIIAHDFEWGAQLGRLSLVLVRSRVGRWTVQRYAGAGLPITASIAPHKATEAVVGRYWRGISAKYGRRIGTAEGDFAQKGYDRADYNLVADAVRAKTSAAIALENLGGVRAPLVKGPITYADLVTMDPFGNTIVTMTLTGAQVRAILGERRPAVSGVRYEVDGRVVKRALVGGSPLDDARAYKVATNSFFARDALFAGATERADTGVGRLSALLEYIGSRGTLRPAYDGRRIVRGVPDE